MEPDYRMCGDFELLEELLGAEDEQQAFLQPDVEAGAQIQAFSAAILAGTVEATVWLEEAAEDCGGLYGGHCVAGSRRD